MGLVIRQLVPARQPLDAGAQVLPDVTWGEPRPRTSTPPLFGRDDDLRTVGAWLAAAHPRLITITGPGGVGKTTLATEVAQDLRRRPGGPRVAVVPLAPIVDPALLAATIGQVLGGTTRDAPALIAHIDRLSPVGPVVLVLDNFEHLLDGALVVSDLLAGCPRLRVVVTSRERLRLRGEREYSLRPLALPAARAGLEPSFGDVAASPAVRLFVERMQDVRAGFALDPSNAADIAEICQRLDGLPLALELAAARTRSLPLPWLVSRLDHSLALLNRGNRDQPERHRTLTGVAAWSYELLSPTERETFRRLAVLPGPFPLAAARAVCAGTGPATGRTGPLADHPVTGDPLPDTDRDGSDASDDGLLDLIDSLIDKSLVVPAPAAGPPTDQPWFSMLETLRQFGLAQLRDNGEETDASERLARWVVAATTAACVTPPSACVAESQFAFCAGHLPAIRAAMGWLETTGDLAALVGLATRVEPFWMVRSFRTEGMAWCQRILDHPAFPTLPPGTRAGAWLIAANLARTQAVPSFAQRCADSALADFEAAGDTLGVAAAENLLGTIALTAGNLPRARRHARRALRLLDDSADIDWRALTRCNLGMVLAHAGETASALALLLEAGELYRDRRNPWGIGTTIVHLATVARSQGRLRDAIGHYRDALETFAPIQPRESLLDIVAGIAAVAVDCGLPTDALRLLAGIETSRSTIAYHLEAPLATIARQTRQGAATRLPADAVAAALAAGERLSFADLIADARTVLDRTVARLDGGFDTARSIAGASIDGLAARCGLTSRESEVLTLIAEGISDREIGERLYISPRTAMRHVGSILAKLGVTSRTAAAMVALREPTDR